MIVEVKNGTITDDLYKDIAQPLVAKSLGYEPLSRELVQDFICSKKVCDVCGENKR